MIIITFDDAVNDENWSLYQKLFPETYKNPNGCPIHGTFYVSHQYSNYAMVQKLCNQGQQTRILINSNCSLQVTRLQCTASVTEAPRSGGAPMPR